MDEQGFDALARAFAGPSSRRRLLRTVVGAVLAGVGGSRLGSEAAAAPCTTVCPEGQYRGSGCRCLCRATGRPPAGGVCPCASGLTACGGGCVDTGRDAAHCGGCGLACAGGICQGGVCQVDLAANGAGCAVPGNCLSGACVNGVCCAEASCAGLDDACQVGICAAGSGVCEARPKPDGTGCDDGDACTVNDACQAGACVGDAVVCPPAPACFSSVGSCIPDTGACPEQYLGDGATCDGGICAGEQCCRVRSGELYDCDPAFGAICVAGDGPLCCPLTDGQACDECYEIYDAGQNLDGGLCCPPELQCGAGNCCWFGKTCFDFGNGVRGCVDSDQICAGEVYCENDRCCGGACCGDTEVCTGGACVPYRRPCGQCGEDEECVGATYEPDVNGDIQEVTPGYCCPFDMVFGTGNDPVPGPVANCCAPRSYSCRGVTCIGFDDDFSTCSTPSLGFLRPR